MLNFAPDLLAAVVLGNPVSDFRERLAIDLEPVA
jgi:hypothetical protein